MTTGQILYLFLAICGGVFGLVKLFLIEKKQINERFQSHADRLSRIEERNRNAPTHEDMGKLHEKMNELNKTQAHMAGVLEGILSTNQLIVKRAMLEQKNG